MKQNNMLAMILAGGRGSRLHDLTNKVAKPAVSYGGKYRIIDFPLSNCANSGIDVVGVLTQYESILLNSYVAARTPLGTGRERQRRLCTSASRKSGCRPQCLPRNRRCDLAEYRFHRYIFSGISSRTLRRPYLQNELCKDARLSQSEQCRRHDRRH